MRHKIVAWDTRKPNEIQDSGMRHKIAEWDTILLNGARKFLKLPCLKFSVQIQTFTYMDIRYIK